METFEKLGAFYLGRNQDIDKGETTDDLFLYDSKDLRTHAVCVGMTGSGKTGLCVSLLEEAAIDGIPALVIDPKGDLTNLMLTFPDLDAASFRPWVNEDEARQKSLTPDAFATQQAELWRNGLAKWGQDGERIRRLKEAANFTVFTPGSSAGAQVAVLSSLDAPPAALQDDPELLAERSGALVSSLLALLGIDADPIKSREHIFLSSLLTHVWSEGRGVDIGTLIRLIQSPPINRIGVLELESFYPAKERFDLSMQLNSLLASPRFQSWMQGEPLDVDKLLYTDTGKPRVSIFSIAHLDDQERMFFVSLLLNQTLGWMRTRSGTSSLRALVYMDEVFGFLPPVANPPSKRPLMTMLKQARAFGVGLVLATQNPADLDYKALSNMGTWFIGRLQTERDKKRLLDGLSSASGGAGDIDKLDDVISNLGKRVFVMHNVHEEKPTVFHTRWAMSYLTGPLTRDQIRGLNDQLGAGNAVATAGAPAGGKLGSVTPSASARPVLAPDIPQRFWHQDSIAGDGRLHYRAAVLGVADVHLTGRGLSTSYKRPVALVASLDSVTADPDWTAAQTADLARGRLLTSPVPGADFGALPTKAANARSYAAWQRDFADALYRGESLDLYTSKRFKMTSEPEESERDFRIRLGDVAREARDAQVAKLRKKYETRFARLDDRIRRAEQRVEVEKDDVSGTKMQTAVSFGATVLSALMGKKAVSRTTLGKATTTLRGASRTAKQARDVTRAKQNLEALQEQRDELSRTFEDDTSEIEDRFDPQLEELQTTTLKPRRTDIDIKQFTLLWVPEATRVL